jgi:hypothetical protein
MKPILLTPLDANGDPIRIDPSSDVAQLVWLLEVARQRGYRIGPAVQIGSLTLQVEDLRQEEGRRNPAAGDPGPWAEHGHTEDGDA